MPVARVNGIDIHYVVERDGEPLVLVHNLIASLRSYDFNAPVLAKHLRVIRYDLRGHGLSSKTDHEGGYTFDNLAADLHGLLEHLNVESCHLLGQAYWGVNTVCHFFAKHPDKVKTLMPVAWYPEVTAVQDRELPAKVAEGFVRMREVARTKGMRAVLEERKKTMTFWIPKILENQDIMRRFEEMYDQASAYAFLNMPVMTEEKRAAIVERLNERRIPVLSMVGIGDPNPERVCAKMKALYPGTHGILLPDCGHYPAIENPEDFNAAVLNFIAGARAYARAS
jgi:2-succinyl-6-hydroxy-2,4-cyclohexadiene-1-carboxylate synthase